MNDMTNVRDFGVTESEQLVQFYKKTYQTAGVCFVAWLGVLTLLFYSGAMVSIAGALLSVNWLIVLGIFFLATWGANMLMAKGDGSSQMLGAGIYVVSYAIIFCPLLLLAAHVSGGMADATDTIFLPALLVTGIIAFGLIIAGQMIKSDMKVLQPIIAIGSIAALVAIIFASLTSFTLGSWFVIGMVLLMCISIFYQVSRFKYQYSTNQYFAAGVSLFASFVVLLWYVIQLFLSRR